MPTRRTFLRNAAIALASPAFAATAQTATALRAAAATVDLSIAGIGKTPVLAVNGSMPGPVLRGRPGSLLALDLTNDLPEPLDLSLQGLRDDAGTISVADGQRVQHVVHLREPGFLLYRPSRPGRAAELTERGIAGALVIDNASLTGVDVDLVALVDDILLDDAGGLGPFGGDPATYGAGRLGNHLLVNGKGTPLRQSVPAGARVRLRIGSLANARIVRLRVEGADASVIAVDSQPCEPFEPVRGVLPLLPGTRYEMLLDLPARPGAAASLLADLTQPVPLVTLIGDLPGPSQGGGGSPAALPLNPSLPVEIRLQDAVRADLVLSGGMPRGPGGVADQASPERLAWRINGRIGTPDGEPLCRARSGMPVVLALANRTDWFQVLHLQGHTARRLHALDDGWDPYWLDTVGIAPGQTVRIAFLAGSPGRWRIGSGVLERLDAGLFGWIEVT